MNLIRKLEDRLNSLESLDYRSALELRMNILEVINYLMNHYVLEDKIAPDKELLAVVNRFQDIYSLLQQLTKNKKDLISIEQFLLIKTEAIKCIHEAKELIIKHTNHKTLP